MCFKTSCYLEGSFKEKISWTNSEVQIDTMHFKHDEKTPAGSTNKRGDYRVSWICLGKDQDEVSVLGKVNTAGNKLEPYKLDKKSIKINITPTSHFFSICFVLN